MSAVLRTDEPLIVVPVDQLRAAGLEQGFDPSVDRILAAAFRPNVARIMPRSAAEVDPRFKQIICYVVLRRGDLIFHYRRSAIAGERRLAGLRSLGVGGHLNADDGSAGDAGPAASLAGLRKAIRRELDEEIVLGEEPAIRYLGIINDDSSEVGRVHVGLVAVADLYEPIARLRDATLVDGRFDRQSAIVERAGEFETWSQLCLPALVNRPETS